MQFIVGLIIGTWFGILIAAVVVGDYDERSN